jgi:hypothetical protein
MVLSPIPNSQQEVGLSFRLEDIAPLALRQKAERRTFPRNGTDKLWLIKN